jgi:hypothetical protein
VLQGYPPQITQQPTSQSVLVGTLVSLTANASGSLPLAYHWQKNGTNLSNTANISGTTSNWLTLASPATNDSGNYTLIVSNAYGMVTSAVATLTVTPPLCSTYLFSTMAGLAGFLGHTDGSNSTARFYSPEAVTVDSAGVVYVADTYNALIRRLVLSGTNWVVKTMAGDLNYGSKDGVGAAAEFHLPMGIVADSSSNVYVGDTYNYTIRRLTPSGTNWAVTTIAGQAGIAGLLDGTNGFTRFNSPQGLAIDNAGTIYVADTTNNVIRQITPVGTNWGVSTISRAIYFTRLGLRWTALPPYMSSAMTSTTTDLSKQRATTGRIGQYLPQFPLRPASAASR